jgi:hypothetical protein
VRLRSRRAALTASGAALAAALIAACDGSGAAAGFAVRDSSGVTIVENAEARDGASAWRIEPEPIVDLGGDASGPAAIFERVAGVVLLEDGGVVAGDEGAGAVRAWDPSGVLRWRAGRAGDGPGEFRLIGGLGAGPSDSLWVWDFGSRRFTVLDGAGTPARTLAVDASISAAAAVGRLADGTFILREMWGRPVAPAASTGLQRDPAAVVAVAADGERFDTVAVRPGREVRVTVEDGRGVMSTPLFSRNTAVAAAGDRVIVGDPAEYALDVLSRDGARRLSFRVSGLDLTIDSHLIGRTVDALLESLPRPERAARRAFLESLPVPPSRPAFGRILVAATGEVWVADFAAPPADPLAWRVFAPDGRWLATVAVPVRFRLEAVGRDRVAGVWRDDLDVERIRVHRLTRPLR